MRAVKWRVTNWSLWKFVELRHICKIFDAADAADDDDDAAAADDDDDDAVYTNMLFSSFCSY